uniref:Uncharacterized protein n=1 Tax=Vitis vinifera TaxID=29760 RepID=F6HY41_VITVI
MKRAQARRERRIA